MQINASNEKKTVEVRRGNQIYINKMKFLSVQHNEKMAGHELSPDLWGKLDLRYLLSEMYESV